MNEDKISPSEFAQKIKAKYPQYADIADDELTKRMLEKYPEYQDMVDFSLGQTTQPVDAQAPAFNQDVASTLMSAGLGTLGYTAPVQYIAAAGERGYQQAQQANAIGALSGEFSPETAQQLAQSQQAIEALPASPAYQRFNQSKGWVDALGSIFSTDGPQIIAELSTESLAAMLTHGVAKIGGGAATGAAMGSVLPGLGTAAGAGAGAIGGIGVTSLNLEYAGSIMESLRETGVDTTNADEIAKVFADEEKLSEFRSHALRRGVPIALLDMASAGIGGSIINKIGTKTLGRKILANTLEMATQGGLGGAGEVAGSLVAGDEITPAAVLGEVFGEFGVGGAEVFTGAQARARSPKQEVTAQVKALDDSEYDFATGVNDIDISIDEAARTDSEFVDQLISKLDALEGAKIEEEIDKASAAAVDALKGKYEAERRLFIKEKLDEFDRTGTIIPQYPSEENDIELYSNLTQPPASVTPIQPAQPAVPTNVTQDQPGLPSPKQARKAAVKTEPKQIPSVETTETSGVVQEAQVVDEQVQPSKGEVTPTATTPRKRGVSEELVKQKEEEKLLKLEERLTKQLANAGKRWPAAKIATYEKIAQQADEAGLEKLAKQAAKLADQEAQAQTQAAEQKELRKAKKEAKAQELIAPKPPKSEQPVLPVKLKKMDVKVPGTLKYLGLNKQEATVGDVKEGFLKEIAYLRNSSDPKYKEVAQNYIDFRKNAGLPEQPMDKVLAEAKKEFYQASAEKRISNEKIERTALKKRTEELKKKGKTDEEVQKTIEGAKERYRVDFAKVFGISPKDISQVQFAGRFDNVIEHVNEELGSIDYDTINEINYNEFKTLAGVRAPLLDPLINVINRYSKKPLTFHTVTTRRPVYAGVHLSSKKGNHIVLAIDKTGKPYGSKTALHELLHDYTNLMLAAVYDNNESFRYAMDKVFRRVEQIAADKIDNLIKKFQKSRVNNLTTEETILFLSLEKLLPNAQSNLLNSYLLADTPYNPDDAATIAKGVYALQDKKELLSEAFSDQDTIEFLSALKTDEKLSETKQYKSVLYKIYEEIVKFVQRLVPSEYKSAMDHLLEAVAHFDEEFTSEQGVYIDTAELPLDVAFSKKVDQAATVANKDIVKRIVKTLMPRKEIQELKDVQDYITRVNKNLPVQKQLGEIYARAVLARIKQTKRRRTQGKVYQSHYLSQAKNRPEYKTSHKYKMDVDDFAKVNIDDLSADQVSTYINGLGNLAVDGIVSEDAYNIMINFGKKKELMRLLIPIAKDLNQSVDGILGWVKANASNPATFSSILAKYKTKNANRVLDAIYGGAMGSLSRSTKDAEALLAQVGDYVSSHGMGYTDMVRVGLVGGIFSTVNDPNADRTAWANEITDNAEHALASAVNKQKALESKNYKGDLDKKQVSQEVAIAQEIHESLRKDAALRSVLNTKQQRVYEMIREFADNHSRDFERNARGVWGNESYTPRYNYFPTMAQGRIDGEVKDDPFIYDNSDNIFEAMEGTNENYDAVYAKKVWSQYNRTNPKGYYYENDALALTQRWSKRLLYDMYASTEMKALNRLFRDPKFNKAFNKDLRGVWKDQVKSIAGASNKYKPVSSAFLKQMLKARGQLYNAAIATSGQILLQSSSGFVAAAVMAANLNPKTGLKHLSKAISTAYQSTFDNFGLNSNTKKLREFLDKTGMGIQLRDVLFEKPFSPEDYHSTFGTKGAKLTRAMSNSTDWALRSGDKLAARLVWFTAYYNAGGTLENPTREAIIAAERMVGVMQNMSDVNFSAPIFKRSHFAKNILLNTVYAFKSFAVNSFINLFYSTGYSLSSAEARQVATAQLGSILAYNALGAMVVRPFYNMLAQGLAGDDSEPDEDKTHSKLEEVLYESAYQTFGLGMIMPAGMDGIWRWFLVNSSSEYLAPDYQEFDQYRDSPIFAPQEPEDAFYDVFGPSGKGVAKIGIEEMKILVAQAQADKYFEDVDKASKREFDQDMIINQAVGILYASQPWLPLRGDAKRIWDGVIRARKRKYFEEHQRVAAPTQASPEETELAAPEYVFPEYELQELN